jgi:hypothetical protein
MIEISSFVATSRTVAFRYVHPLPLERLGDVKSTTTVRNDVVGSMEGVDIFDVVLMFLLRTQVVAECPREKNISWSQRTSLFVRCPPRIASDGVSTSAPAYAAWALINFAPQFS